MKPTSRFFRSLLISSFLFSSLELLLHPVTANAQVGTFSATGSMGTARYQGGSFTGTLLPNGKVLVAGGCSGDCDFGATAQASAELYDPTAGTFSPTGSMTTQRVAYTATLLPTGKVLVAGGYGGAGGLATAELYDPTTGTFSATGSMTAVRSLHTATLLLTGKVLIAGGCGVVFGSCGDNVTSAELYDPTTGTFSATGTMTTGRRVHLATLLPNGKVLVTGGATDSVIFASAELYDPTTGTFGATGSMTTPRYTHTATLLPNGKVLVAGGYNGSSLASAELYDPTAGTFSATGSMAASRGNHTATLLPDGQVLVAGGNNSSGYLASAELYDATTGVFSVTGSMNTARGYHLATLLSNGKTLVAGGANSSGLLASAELYDPGLAAAPTTYTYTGNSFTSFHNDGCPTPACNITGKFTVPYPLVGLLIAVAPPASFSFTDGNTVWTNSSAMPTAFTLSTDANGNVTGWNISLEIPTAFGSPTILFTNSFDACCSSGHDGAFSYFGSGAGDYLGESNANNPGTWARVLTTPPPAPSIKSAPANPTNQTAATFTFADAQAGVTFVCSLDGSSFSACTSGQSYTGLPQGGHTFSVEAKDSSGNLSTPASFTWTIDTMPPTISGSATPPANGFGWNNTNVTISFTCSDALSGIASCSAPTTLTGEGALQSVTGTAMDNAGNTAQAKVTVNIDKTSPTVTYTGNSGTYTVDQTVAITCTAADALSGVASTTCSNINGAAYSIGLGPHSYNATATDKAGNVGNGSTSFTVTVTAASLSNLVSQFVSNPGVANALISKLSAAQAAAARGDVNALDGELRAFINQVSAQSGKSLSVTQAAILIQMATALMI